MTRSLRSALVARNPLRLRVLAGVVVVTLAALAAFDLTAVTTMRHYLYGQARSELSGAVPDLGELPALTNFGHTLTGQYDIAWLPTRGKPFVIQIPLNTDQEAFTNAAARAVAKPGFHTVPVAGQITLLDNVAISGGSTFPSGSIVVGTSLAPVTNTLVQIERIVMIGSAVVLLLIGAGVFMVLRLGLRPIEVMAVQADRITAGDLADRVAPHNPRSEVGRLGAALNGMLTRIEAAVQEREISQEQMRQFFADASHELRTPLASLLANAELYEHGALTEPAQISEVMRRMALETQRMGRLVDDMLRLARLGQHPGQCREPVDLTALVADCAERARITDPSRRWQVDVADGLEVTGDEEQLRRAVDNLCANVLVHTPHHTVGTIAATASDGQVRIKVSDDGPGVAADRLPHIFERFYRADTGSSRPGSGLGLAIVMEVAAAHGGTAEAAPAPSHGLRITLTLPVEQPTSVLPRPRGNSRTRPPPVRPLGPRPVGLASPVLSSRRGRGSPRAGGRRLGDVVADGGPLGQERDGDGDGRDERGGAKEGQRR
jgi:two-component system, OmpR family, sensor kinase